MTVSISEPCDSIMQRAGVRPLGRRGRGECPFCDSRTGFSFSDDLGLFHCFACGAKGDKVGFVMQLLECDFKAALRFFGLEPGKPPAPDPAVVNRQKMREGLRLWVRRVGRPMRERYYQDEMVAHAMRKRLQRDPEDREAWDILATAMHGHAALEHKLDALIGTEADQIELFMFTEKTR